MTTCNTYKEKFPPPEKLKKVIELPAGAPQEIAEWLDVPIRTLYTWLDGRHPNLSSRAALSKKVIVPDNACASEMRLAFYGAWWRAKNGLPPVNDSTSASVATDVTHEEHTLEAEGLL